MTVIRSISAAQDALADAPPIYTFGLNGGFALAMQRWFPSMNLIVSADAFDGADARVWVTDAQAGPWIGPQVSLQVDAALSDPAIAERIAPGGGLAIGLVLDSHTEQALSRHGLVTGYAPADLRNHLGSKIVMTQIADDLGVPTIPHVLAAPKDYAELRALSDRRGLGDDLVIQVPVGAAGIGTYFVSTAADWDAALADPHLGAYVGHSPLRIMRRVRPRNFSIDGVVLRDGVLVGPPASDLVGCPSLTPWTGGWVGADMHRDAVEPEAAAACSRIAADIGAELGRRGFWGAFEVDVVLDTETGEYCFGEVNTRLSGISQLTTMVTGAQTGLPMIALHFLTALGATVAIPVEELNEAFASAELGWSLRRVSAQGFMPSGPACMPRVGDWKRDGSEIHRIRDARDAFDCPDDAMWLMPQDRPAAVALEGFPVVDVTSRRQIASGDGALNSEAEDDITAIRAVLSGQGSSRA